MRRLGFVAILTLLFAACGQGSDDAQTSDSTSVRTTTGGVASASTETLPPGTLDAFCREAAQSPFGTVHGEFDPAAWSEAVERMHIAAPVDLREDTQALVDLEAAVSEPQVGTLDPTVVFDFPDRFQDLCGIDVQAAFSDEHPDADRLADAIQQLALSVDGFTWGDLLGHVLVSAGGLTTDDASALCEAAVVFRSGLANADSVAIFVATASDGDAAYDVLAVSPPGGSCTT